MRTLIIIIVMTILASLANAVELDIYTKEGKYIRIIEDLMIYDGEVSTIKKPIGYNTMIMWASSDGKTNYIIYGYLIDDRINYRLVTLETISGAIKSVDLMPTGSFAP